MSGQIRIFLICTALGLIGGILYDVLSCLRFPFRKVRLVRLGTDVLFCLIYAVFFLFASVLFHFPDFRLFMAVGCLVGIFLYRKSFHKFVAFLGKMVYNEIGQLRKDKRKCRTRSGLCRRRKRKGSPLPQS